MWHWLVIVSNAVMKHHDQNQLGEESVYLVYTSTLQSIIGGREVKNSKQGLKLEAGHGRVLLTGLLSLLSYRTQDHQLRDEMKCYPN